MTNPPNPRKDAQDDRPDEAKRRGPEQDAQELPGYTPQGRTDEPAEPVDAPGYTPQGRTEGGRP
jgi:hypothetical protein